MKKTLKRPSEKEEAIKLIRKLPSDCSLEDIQYHLYVRKMVEKGIRDVDEGKVIPHAKAKKRMKAWLKSVGLEQP